MKELNDLFCMEDLRDEIINSEAFLTDQAISNLSLPDWICKVAPVIIMALKIALLFVGRREKEIIRAVIDGLRIQCDID